MLIPFKEFIEKRDSLCMKVDKVSYIPRRTFDGEDVARPSPDYSDSRNYERVIAAAKKKDTAKYLDTLMSVVKGGCCTVCRLGNSVNASPLQRLCAACVVLNPKLMEVE